MIVIRHRRARRGAAAGHELGRARIALGLRFIASRHLASLAMLLTVSYHEVDCQTFVEPSISSSSCRGSAQRAVKAS